MRRTKPLIGNARATPTTTNGDANGGPSDNNSEIVSPLASDFEPAWPKDHKS